MQQFLGIPSEKITQVYDIIFANFHAFTCHITILTLTDQTRNGVCNSLTGKKK